MNETSEHAADQPAPKKTREMIAAEQKSLLEQNGINIAKLAEPLIKSSCRVDKDGDAFFDPEQFVMILSKMASMVLLEYQVKITVEKIDFQ